MQRQLVFLLKDLVTGGLGACSVWWSGGRGAGARLRGTGGHSCFCQRGSRSFCTGPWRNDPWSGGGVRRNGDGRRFSCSLLVRWMLRVMNYMVLCVLCVMRSSRVLHLRRAPCIRACLRSRAGHCNALGTSVRSWSCITRPTHLRNRCSSRTGDGPLHNTCLLLLLKTTHLRHRAATRRAARLIRIRRCCCDTRTGCSGLCSHCRRSSSNHSWLLRWSSSHHPWLLRWSSSNHSWLLLRWSSSHHPWLLRISLLQISLLRIRSLLRISLLRISLLRISACGSRLRRHSRRTTSTLWILSSRRILDRILHLVCAGRTGCCPASGGIGG